MNDPANPGWDQTNQGIIASEFSESDVKTVMQPRIGFAFPVSDETVFHLQYGKFAQMPELDLPYSSPRYMNLVWGGQNYTPDPMGFDLDPIEIALCYQRLINEVMLTQDQMSKRVGKKRSTIANYVRLLKLDPIIQSGIRDGFITMGHGRALLSLSLIHI